VKDYVVAEPLLSNDTVHAAGMQGHPHSLDDLTDGQIEDRFYQSVPSCCSLSHTSRFCLTNQPIVF